VIFHKDREIFSQAVEATAVWLKINPLFVEKDYWVTYVLKSLSVSEFSDIAIFKGGTSLSKAYKLIERFSEDIDLAVITNDKSSNQIKKLLKSIESALLDANFTEIKEHPKSSKGSQFRKTLHSYPKREDGDFGEADENIMLEINSFASPYPFDKMPISSYIADFLSQKEPSLTSKYQLEPFFVNVLDIKRTFCEKLSAVARASHESDEEYNQLKVKIRHLYDIHFLMQDSEIKSFVKSEDFKKMLKDVRYDDQAQFSSSWADIKLCKTDIFSNSLEVIKKLEKYYNESFSQLVYSDFLPDILEIEKSILEVGNLLQQNDL